LGGGQLNQFRHSNLNHNPFQGGIASAFAKLRFAARRHALQCWAFSGFRGCEGPQPSKVRNDYRSFDQALEGVRSLGAVLVDASFVLPQEAMGTMLGL